MSTYENPYASLGSMTTAALAPAAERAAFIRKTYTHLAAAIYGFVALEFAIFTVAPVDAWMAKFFAVPYAHLLLLGCFIGAAWIAESWARSGASVEKQYAGLLLYIVAEAVIFVPLLWYAQTFAGGLQPIGIAGLITLMMFGGLTAFVFISGADFSFLRTALMIGMLAAFGLILGSVFLGFHLGMIFSVAMVVLASGWILYDTSNVLHHYRTDQHVAASLALFASVALLFWYVLRIVIALTGRD